VPSATHQDAVTHEDLSIDPIPSQAVSAVDELSADEIIATPGNDVDRAQSSATADTQPSDDSDIRDIVDWLK
jgi:hypothetical protein